MYSEVPGECILKKPQVELMLYVEKWLTTIPPPNTMTFEKWAKMVMEEMESGD